MLWLFLLWLLLQDELSTPCYYGLRYHKLALTPSFGVGRGQGPRMRRRSPKAYRARAIARFDPNRVQGLVHCSPHEFNDLMEELLYLKAKLRSTARHMKFKDKLFLVFIWIMHYPAYSLLSHIFGVSQRTVSTLITFLLPLVEFFISFIPETLEDDARCSVLSNFIVAIVDSTIHPTRKPSSGQHLYWNGHYKTHGILTHLNRL